MPSRAWPIWLYTILLLVGYPVVNWIYWPQVLEANVLPPDGDSIAIAMFNSIVAAMVTAPLVLGFTGFCLASYNRKARLFAWRSDKPVRSTVATLLFGALAFATIRMGRDSLQSDFFEVGSYVYLFPAYMALWLPWLLWLRAAVIERQGGLFHRPYAISVSSLGLVVACIAGAIPASALTFLAYIWIASGKPEMDAPPGPEWQMWAAPLTLLAFTVGAYVAGRLIARPHFRHMVMLAPVPLLAWGFIAYRLVGPALG